MATISPRYDDQKVRIGWQARIRKQGYPSQVKTFRTKAEAEAWAKVTESEMVRGVFVQRTESERTTVKEILDRYIVEVLPEKKSQQSVRSAAGIVIKHIGSHSLASLSPSILAKYRDQRLSTGISTQTVRHELSLLSRVLNLAIKEWGISLPMGNPVLQIKMPSPSKARDRRLVGNEEERLLKECRESRNPWLLPVVRFAIETAMRVGEILETKDTTDPKTGIRSILTPGLFWNQVDMKKHTAFLPKTKNGEARTVPLSSTAMEVLIGLPRSLNGKVFDTTYEAIHLAFARACKRAGIKGLHLHDLRHEATSRLFEKRKLNIMEVKSITGHKTLQMLTRYTHLRAEDLVKLLG
ncbi:site-specific integrase [Acidithiobacillus sp. M4-SHS-6]|uniref:site-specific integrase n=1 Tax=Acidithiobacillus sp. M4-SHS-6 TaxID=3383024 RepID=UPI0039BE79E3